MTKKIVTRFAPSPTGMIHIGSARTALFNYLYSKHTGGEYKLRIEDTDTKRNVEGGVEAIIEGFKWLGIEHDGDIVFQSKNIERHKEVAMQLLKNGHAYYCYTSQEELAEKRLQAEKEGKVFKFNSPWRDAKQEDTPKDINPVIRIKAPLYDGVEVNDTVLGIKTIPSNALDDFIIMRSDGTPTYMLAVVVDDHDVGVTHIIRGNEHYANASRQNIISNAMGWDCPTFCHIPLILGKDKTKLSKRHGAASIMEYKEMGYLPEALKNYLVRLCWSHGDDELFNETQAIEWFDIANVGSSPAVFDTEKLNSVNQHYIKLKDNEKLFNLCFPNNNDVDFKDRCLKAMNMIKDRSTFVNDIKDNCLLYKIGYEKELDDKSIKIMNKEGRIKLSLLLEIIEGSKVFLLDDLKEKLKSFAESMEWKMKDWTQIMRVALCFSSISAGSVFEILVILGKEEAVRRMRKFTK